ncbi:TRAP transporter large permease [Aquibaculum sediminis]|uniref:TRAP transporter large permease n=1 Tax=Aquibaculum sediminis TaxID=3231907 RepID=UPI0034534B46
MLLTIAITLPLFIILGVPLGFAILASSLSALLIDGNLNMMVAAQRVFSGFDSFSLLAIPLFLLAGSIMAAGGLSDRLVTFANALVGRFRGGLGISNILASVMFGGISGSAVADTSAIGRTFIPAMTQSGYPARFAVATTVASAPLSPIIPPSIAWILYGYLTDTSILQLFIAGIVPAFLWALTMIGVVVWKAKKENYPVHGRVNRAVLLSTMKAAVFALLLPVFVIVGIRMAVFTVTEASAIAVLYALFVGALIYRELTWLKLWNCFKYTVQATAVVMIIIGAANLFAWVLAYEQAPARVASWAMGLSDNPIIFLLIINVVLLVIGTFMEVNAAKIMTLPILFPLVMQFGIDPVHFGVIITANLCLALMTPPVGIVLALACKIGDVPLEQGTVAVMPFFLAGVFVVLALTLFPGLSLWLPSLIIG